MARLLVLAIFLLLTGGGDSRAAVRNFFAPQVDGNRIDSCLASAGTCGKPAADAFCKAEGYDNAILFQREPLAQTRRLGSGEICEGGACSGFKQIKCFTEKGDLAGLEQAAD